MLLLEKNYAVFGKKNEQDNYQNLHLLRIPSMFFLK